MLRKSKTQVGDNLAALLKFDSREIFVDTAMVIWEMFFSGSVGVCGLMKNSEKSFF